jgi:hypothetical protein
MALELIIHIYIVISMGILSNITVRSSDIRRIEQSNRHETAQRKMPRPNQPIAALSCLTN